MLKKVTIGKPYQAKFDPIEKIALHEAGHCAMALALGCLPVSSSVEDYKKGKGFTNLRDDVIKDSTTWALIACGGSIAEEVSWINAGDYFFVKKEGFKKPQLPILFEMGSLILDHYQGILKNLTLALIKKKKLDYIEICEIACHTNLILMNNNIKKYFFKK